jgi:hypothetical protein
MGGRKTLGAIGVADRAREHIGDWLMATAVTIVIPAVISSVVPILHTLISIPLSMTRRDEPRMTHRMTHRMTDHHRRWAHRHSRMNRNNRRRADWTRSYDHRGRAHRTWHNHDRRRARRRRGNHNARNVRQWEADADIKRHTGVSTCRHGTRNTDGSQSQENFRFHTCKVRRSIQVALQKWPIETGSASINSINGWRSTLLIQRRLIRHTEK